MLSPTTNELNYARTWIGFTETAAVFTERMNRLSTEIEWDERRQLIDAAIEDSLRNQLAVMELDQPASVSLPGGLSVSYGENMRGLREHLKDFRDNYSTAKGTGTRVTQLVRERRR